MFIEFRVWHWGKKKVHFALLTKNAHFGIYTLGINAKLKHKVLLVLKILLG